MKATTKIKSHLKYNETLSFLYLFFSSILSMATDMATCPTLYWWQISLAGLYREDHHDPYLVPTVTSVLPYISHSSSVNCLNGNVGVAILVYIKNHLEKSTFLTVKIYLKVVSFKRFLYIYKYVRTVIY